MREDSDAPRCSGSSSSESSGSLKKRKRKRRKQKRSRSDRAGNDSHNLLLYAALGKYKRAKKLVKKGAADVNFAGPNEDTALHLVRRLPSLYKLGQAEH